MKFRWDRHYLGWGITAFIVIVASVIVSTMLYNYKDIFKYIGGFLTAIEPIFIGFIIAYLMNPIVSFFENKAFRKLFTKKDKTVEPVLAMNDTEKEKCSNLRKLVRNKPRRILSIFAATAILLGLIAAICYAVIPQLFTTITLIVDNIPSYVKHATEWINNAFASFPDLGEDIVSMINEAGTALRGFLTTNLLPQMGDYLSFLTAGIMNVFGVLMNLLLGLVVAIYCLYSKELFAAQGKKLIYCIMNVKHANRFIHEVRKFHKTFGNFITGTLIDSFVVGCITFIVTTIFRVPFALLVSVIMGVTNIIPYFGPFIGIVPCLFLIFMEDPIMCIVFTVIVIILQNVNGNIISPKIIGDSTGLTSFWVIFAILAGQGIFGFWGLIIGIPVFAVVYGAVRSIISTRLKDKGLPRDTGCYTDIEAIDPADLTARSLSEKIEAERIELERLEKELEAARKKNISEKNVLIRVKNKLTGKGKKG